VTAPSDTSRTTVATRPRSALYSALIGLASLGVLLQGVWAGMFIREGQGNNDGWVEVHARGAEITLALAVIAAIVAAVKLRSRRDVLVGSILFVVLLAVESFIGGIVGGNPALQTVHFPLAMALLGLAVWLPTRASRPMTMP
jgi:heme A synthase